MNNNHSIMQITKLNLFKKVACEIEEAYVERTYIH